MDSDSELPNGTAESTRRKSGRVPRRPDVFAEEEHAGSLLTNGSAKRKRISNITAEDIQDDDDDDDSSEDGDSDSEPGEEELKEKRRNQRKRPKVSKSASKRAGAKPSTTLAIRSANVPSRSASKSAKIQKARARQSQVNKEGLYAEVFGRGQTAEEAANTWLSSVRKDSVVAIRDLINLIFESIGCDVKIASSDIEDIDNVPSKLSDVLEEQYSHGQSADYPLVSKSRQFAEFKTVLVDFFKAVILALHNSSVLYDQLAVYDNIHVWVATMTGAKYRPFRHTATVISLAMSSALCTLPGDIQKRAADYKKQFVAEKKKRSSNKARLASLQEELKSEEKKLEIIDTLLRDAFDTVYVHRYRDVDEKIRVECVAALGGWIDKYSTMFLEGQYLRYLGWVMSDPNAATRLEVIRQVKKLFSDKNVAALRAFTERFRSRIVEMGARDADVSVRVESIDLLDRLRLHELLEPDDIDTVGRLIFDAEPRVRKAVGKFFVASIDDLYNTLTEDWDTDQYNEALPPMHEADGLGVASQSWIKFKCLAQTLTNYDARSESAESPETNVRTLASTEDAESRYMLATQSLYPHFKDLEHWESLAAYLLYDHSSISADAEDDDVAQAVQGTYKLNDGEETVLLDVLYFSVKLYLASVLDLARDKKGRTNATKDNIKQKQETAAHNLSNIVPQLLSRYGSTPQAAASILRLEQLLDADLISDLQGGEATYSRLLDDIDKQFSSHSDRKVLAEASRALRVARTFEQSKDAATTKVQEMWTEVIANLQRLLRGRTVDTRGSLEYNIMKELVNICVRTANLAGISDCSSILEQSFPQSKKVKAKAGSWESGTVLELFLRLVARGVPDEDTTDGINELEDQISVAVITTLSFYFRWKVVALKQAVEANDTRSLTTPRIVSLGVQRSTFIEALTPVITNRLPLDPVRFNALLTTLDVFTLFATTKHLQPKPGKGDLNEDVAINVASLTAKVPETLFNDFMITFDRAEKMFARRARRKLTDSIKKSHRSHGRANTADIEEPTQEEIEKPPEDSDDSDNEANDASESEDDGAEGITGHGGRDSKKQAALVAEQSLCEVTSKLVLALIAGVLEKSRQAKERLMVNRTKLGKSYAGVVAYLDEKKDKKKAVEKKMEGKQVGGGGAKGKSQAKSAELVTEEMELEDDRIDDDDDDDDDRGGDGVRRDAVEREIVEEELAEAELAENENENDSADENEGLLRLDGEDEDGDGEDQVMGD
jgi:cohesin complex subunit SA-1/2